MTDNEIIKALEHCSSEHLPCGSECPAWKVGCETEKYALDLIKRQKAEIERLENVPNVWKDIAHRETNYVAQAKSEAIKEFAERLKYKTCCIPQCHFTYAEVEFRIDNLVEEITVNYESTKTEKQRKDEGK